MTDEERWQKAYDDELRRLKVQYENRIHAFWFLNQEDKHKHTKFKHLWKWLTYLTYGYLSVYQPEHKRFYLFVNHYSNDWIVFPSWITLTPEDNAGITEVLR